MIKTKTCLSYLLLTICILALSLFGGAPAQAQVPQYFRVSCLNEQPQVEISGWKADESLTTLVDRVEVDQFTTDADGAGRYIFDATGLHDLQLQRANGENILAGFVDCSGPPPEIQYIDVNPFEVKTPLGTTVNFTAQGKTEAGDPVDVNMVWTTTGGSFDAPGQYRATEEGQFLITVSLVGQNRSYSCLIDTTVSPPPVRMEIGDGELFIPVGNTVWLDAIGYDADDNSMPLPAIWRIEPGELNPDGTFEATQPGDYIVTASVEPFGLQASAIIHVYVLLEQISIQPVVTEMTVGDTQQFEVLGVDMDGNQADLPNPPVWNAEIGEIDQAGIYQATTAGDETITVVVEPVPVLGQSTTGGVLGGPRKPYTATIEYPVNPTAVPEIGELPIPEIEPEPPVDPLENQPAVAEPDDEEAGFSPAAGLGILAGVGLAGVGLAAFLRWRAARKQD